MTEWGIKIGILAILLFLLLILLFWIYRSYRKRRAIHRLEARTEDEKREELNRLIEPYGFGWEANGDSFYSLRNPWQRKIGYRKLFDEMAPSTNMIIDCEPIYFDYDNRSWLIEFWKGQYGITTGAEVGIYYANPQPDKSAKDLHYHAVSDEDSLPIRFALQQNGITILERQDIHWWLTGFVLGQYSEPHQLSLITELTFPTEGMRDAFVAACLDTGYTAEELSICYNKVQIIFFLPHTIQPHRYGYLYRRVKQQMNRMNCRKYHRLTRKFSSTPDRILYLLYAFPHVYRILSRVAMEKKQR